MFSEEVQRVYEEIKNGILDETYEPGRALPEIPLAQKYGVKRTRIRQIFQKLERDTLVEIIPARGAFVKPISMIDWPLEKDGMKISKRSSRSSKRSKMINPTIISKGKSGQGEHCTSLFSAAPETRKLSVFWNHCRYR
jgi:DNA-binding GntR family transcriptional regulator